MMTGLMIMTSDLAKKFEEWIDGQPFISVGQRLAFNSLVEEVRSITRPLSKHPLTYTGDLDLFASMFPATAKRIKEELNRMQSLLDQQ
jgi:hypothetical protein